MLVRKTAGILACAISCFVFAGAAAAQQSASTEDAVERELQKYRQMMREDPWSNPAMLDVDQGEELWKKAAGPKNVSLEQCDLGKGPGVVDGAFAELPRYFADADRVMDVETRILWCREKLQGIDNAEYLRRPHPGGAQRVKDVGLIATFIASRSNGMKFAAKMEHPKEKETVELGKKLFNARMGPFDFSCTSCHAASGQRIRLQPLPFLADPAEARAVVGEWPAYRVSSTHVMTMQHRVFDCFWQMRMHQVQMGSEVSNALIAYMIKNAEGGEIVAPGMKR